MEHSIIGLLFDAPLQSWDVGSRHSRRGTLPAPTRSGIIGIIAAAMRIDKNDLEEPLLLSRFQALRMEAFSLSPHKILSDYHIAQECGQADGGVKKHAVITHRSYLMEARFLICLSCPDSTLLKEIEEALMNPAWGGWLGRKSCVPASPIYLGRFSSLLAVKEHVSRWMPEVDWNSCGLLRELNIDEVKFANLSENMMSIDDVPLSFAKREFSSRKVALTFFRGEK